MSFLDNLGNAINTAYDGVSKKAKVTTDILKVTQNIKQLRGSIEIQYLNIGKKYF